MSEQDSEILALWKNIDYPGSFSNIEYFLRTLRERGIDASRARVKKVLQENATYQTSRALKRSFPRRTTQTYYFSERWEADLGDIGKRRFVDFKTPTIDKGHYFFLAVDVFSRKFFVKALKDKTSGETLAALKSILASLKTPYTVPLVIELYECAL